MNPLLLMIYTTSISYIREEARQKKSKQSTNDRTKGTVGCVALDINGALGSFSLFSHYHTYTHTHTERERENHSHNHNQLHISKKKFVNSKIKEIKMKNSL
jgi:hypothetical protein